MGGQGRPLAPWWLECDPVKVQPLRGQCWPRADIEDIVLYNDNITRVTYQGT